MQTLCKGKLLLLVDFLLFSEAFQMGYRHHRGGWKCAHDPNLYWKAYWTSLGAEMPLN